MERKKTKELYISEEIIMPEISATDNFSAIEILAKRLCSQNIVKESFIKAVIDRERTYCTGLQFPEMGIAIPHTDSEHVNMTAIGIATLKQPVKFKFMGMEDLEVNVEIIFMLAIKEAHTQVEFLQTLIELFQNEGNLKTLKALKDPKKILSVFKKQMKEVCSK